MEQVPLTVIAGMMGGVLFGTNIFKSLLEDPLTVVLMIVAFLLLKRFAFVRPVLPHCSSVWQLLRSAGICRMKFAHS